MISSGFFNSIKHDRRYNALQFGSIYDGVIRDGIFMSIGTCFQITESDPNSMNVIIGEGRGWFDHSWILNDAPEPLLMPQSELLLARIDAIVIETNQEESIRRNSIKVVSGEPSDTPQKPTLLRTDLVNQYPLAYVTIHADSNSIRQADIENTVGSEPCPFVTGILETIDTTMLVAQWKDEWEAIKEGYDVDWQDWYTAKLEEIQTWYEFVKDTLGEDAAVGLANAIYDLNVKIDNIVVETLEQVDVKLQGLIDENLQQSLEIQNLQNSLVALNTKVDNAISGGSLAPPFTLNLLQTPYTVYSVGADYNGGWHYPEKASNSSNGFSWLCPEAYKPTVSMQYGRTYNPIEIKGTAAKPYKLKANIAFTAPYQKEALGNMLLEFLQGGTVVHTIQASRSNNYNASIVTELLLSSWNNKSISFRIRTSMASGDYAYCNCTINQLVVTNQ